MRLFLLPVLVLFLQGTIAQQVQLSTHLSGLKARSIGPAGMSGRITAIDAVHDNPNIIYLGAASGGVWKTENGGAKWTPVFDEQPIQNIGAIAIQQDNPAVVWVGTGEGNPRNSVNLGEGMYKTLDGGKTWKRVGLEKTKNIHRVIIHPGNPDIVYAGAIGNPFASHPERGVFKTTDGGESWKKILFTTDSAGIGDMVMDPVNPNKLFAAMWSHRRTPYSMHSGGTGSGFYVTLDGGATWKKLGKENGLPAGDYGRIGVAISRSNPDVVYALIEATKNGLYKSTDGGNSWSLINDNPQWVTNRPFYFQDIAVDPVNENRLWLIYQMIAKSEDGGKNFDVIIPYNGIHPDHHAFWISRDGKFIVDGNDGGIGITRDGGKNWIFDEKLPVGQFYHINVDNEIPYNVMGGMQDNGSWRGPAYTWVSSGIKNYYWENLWGGDGFDVMPDAEDANWVYAMSQGGNVGRYNVQTGERWNIKPSTTDLSNQYRFNWNAAMAQDPFDKKTIYFGSQYLHKSTDKGISWSVISPDLTTNDSVKMDQTNNGGLSVDITAAENFCTLITIAPSAVEQGVIWVGTDDGNVQLTRDDGKSWTNFRGKIKGFPEGAYVHQITASKHRAGEALVSVNDYRRGNMAPYVFRTTDFGKTWTRIVDEQKITGYVMCALQDPAEPNLLFVGSEQGLWVSLDNGNSFQQFKNEFPSVSTFDLAIQEREADLVIATFGRAIYIVDDIRPLRTLASNKGQLPAKFMAFPAGTTYQAQFRSAPGYDWSNWGLYDGENKGRGAGVTYYLPASARSNPARKDSVHVAIYNSNNELVRNLIWMADSGMNRHYWQMEENGVRGPGSPKPRPGAMPPRGSQALAGTYKVVLKTGKHADSTQLTIKDDPRLGNRNAVVLAQRKLEDRLRKSMNSFTENLDKLAEAEAAIKRVEDFYKEDKSEEAAALKKSIKSIKDSVSNIREFISGMRQTRQGYGQVPQITVMNQMQLAMRSISAKPVAPGSHEEELVDHAEKMIAAGESRISNFLNTAFKQFREKVEKVKVDFFKEQ